MNADDLRAIQAPLKQRYRDHPGTAATALSARADYSDPGITATVPTWAGVVRSGLHRATGGDGSDACSGDMLLQALLACAAVTMRSVATAMGIEMDSAEFEAHSTFDARGTLGVDREVPVGIGPVRIEVQIATTASDEALSKLAQLSERYCVVGQSLNQPVTWRIQRSSPVH